MARKPKQKPAEQPTNGSAPMTLADIEVAIDREAKRLSQAETALAVNSSDAEAEAVRVDSLAKLDVLDSNRKSLQRIEEKRRESAEEKAQRARNAADQKIAEIIPDRIDVEQRKLFKEKIMRGLELLAEGIPEFEALQHENQGDILSLRGGKRGKIEPLMTAARNLSLTLQIRDSVKALNGTRLLSPWVTFKVPSLPDRQPQRGESHDSAKAQADALLARTVDDVFDECVERVQSHLNLLLGDPVETVEDAGMRWHGKLDSEPSHDSFTELMNRGELKFDDSAERRRVQRVKDSAAPITRDGEGAITAAAEASEDMT